MPEKGVSGAPLPGPPVLRRRPGGAFELSFGGGGPAAPVTPEDVLRIYGEMKSALTQEAVKRPGGPSWSPGQAAGASDTPEAGDRTTAWAPREQDAGREWLHLKYPAETELAEITIHESFNPGALSKVSAVMPDGGERVIWEGRTEAGEGFQESVIPVPPGIRAGQIRVELDTARVPGWNEIDAVEITGRDGSRQWAAEATASSYYAQP